MKPFEDYIEQRSASIKKNWKKYLEGKDEERLHQMRVEIKKLMALLHFINEAEKDFDLSKHSKLPHHLLEICGELRDHYNFHLLAEKFQFRIPSLHAQMEQYESQQAFQKLQLSYRKHHTSLSQIKLDVNKYLKHLGELRLDEYVAGLTKNINERIEKGLVKDQLHELRKKMKELVYLLKLLEGEAERIPVSRIAEKMDEMQDLIGQWHDISKFEATVKEMKNARPVKRIMDNIFNEKKRLLNEISRLSKLVLAESGESISA